MGLNRRLSEKIVFAINQTYFQFIKNKKLLAIPAMIINSLTSQIISVKSVPISASPWDKLAAV